MWDGTRIAQGDLDFSSTLSPTCCVSLGKPPNFSEFIKQAQGAYKVSGQRLFPATVSWDCLILSFIPHLRQSWILGTSKVFLCHTWTGDWCLLWKLGAFLSSVVTHLCSACTLPGMGSLPPCRVPCSLSCPRLNCRLPPFLFLSLKLKLGGERPRK